MQWILVVLAVLVASLAGAPPVAAGGADLKAALVRCADVTLSAPLTGCGDDPLERGRIEINRHGDLDTSVTGALPNATYDVVLHSANMSVQLPLAVLGTDAKGSGRSRLASVFTLDQAGIVALTLSRNGSIEFVAGFSGGGDKGHKGHKGHQGRNDTEDLDAGLVPCAAVNTPLPLTGCGTDALRSGSVKLDDGDLRIDLTATPVTTYQVVFRPLGGGSDVPLAMLTTDKWGRASLRLKDVVGDDVVGAGNVVLRRDDLDQFITGFQSMRKRPPVVARFHVGLVRCATVNTLAPLAECGFDQLNRGDVIIDDRGDVNVHVQGAVAFSTYEVFFVGADATTEVLIGTLTTNPAGNGHMIVRDAFPVGTVAVGHVILKRGGIDQYVTGFAVVR